MSSDQTLSENSAQFIWWLVRTFFLPVSIPWIAYKAVKAAQYKSRRSQLQDKVVIITGASSGIGEAAAHKLYAQGCHLVLVSRQVAELNRVKNDLINTKPNVTTHVPVVMQLDITDSKSIPEVINKVIDIFGHIDILINNAGTSFRGLVIDTDVDVYMKIMMVNYFAHIAMTKAVLPHMVQRKSGNIIFTSSLQAKVVLPCRSAYAASKHAVQAFADCLRSEVGKYNIKVSLISPSYVRTSLSVNALTSKGLRYGKTDGSTKKGDEPEMIADDIIEAIVTETREIVRGPFHHKAMNYARVLCPPLYFKILAFLEKSMTEEMNRK